MNKHTSHDTVSCNDIAVTNRNYTFVTRAPYMNGSEQRERAQQSIEIGKKIEKIRIEG
jgi:hypothetical protein